MQESVFTRIDEIEKLDPDPSRGQELEAFELMNAFARGPEELRALIDRYGSSTTPIISQSLGSVVAVRAQEPTQEMARLVLTFVARFRCWKPDETVMNALTAVQHCLHYVEPSVGESLRSLSPFFRKCLAYEGRLWVIIRGHALALLPIIVHRDLINAIFTPEELLELRERIRELRRTAGEELRPELEDLQGIIEE